MKTTLDQLYQTKAQLIAVLSTAVGIGLLMLSKWPPAIEWLTNFPVPIPLTELGAGFFGFGVLGIYFQNLDRTAGEKRLEERIHKAVRHEAPAFRDAVLDSLAFKPETLKDLASDDQLDRIAANALGLRLRDGQLADELYADLRDQVITAQERWRDVNITVSMRPRPTGPETGQGSMFVATIRWEYKVKPAASTMRFACVSDKSEYRDLLRDQAITSAWYFGESSGLAADDPEVFELATLSVNGKEKRIRRSSRNGSQLYAVSIGEHDREVTVAYTYRVLVQRHGHVLYLDLPRPAKGLHVHLDYAAAGIRRMNVIDYFASNQTSRVEQPQRGDDNKTTTIGFDSWALPRAGFVCVWVLDDEL